ncbi:MAG: TPM domain-containing protein, partial [Ruminococcaceae bacterium]|nr:TPM domain-containing protein [Oscillospiraceae bacterium]
DVLTDSEEAMLLAMLDETSERQQIDIVICTTPSTNGYSAMDYADNFFEDYHYGMGEERDCILLMISMEGSSWHITTAGYGITAVTDVGIEYIGERIVPLMSEGEFADAFSEYISICDRFTDMARGGDPYDADNIPKGSFPAVRNLLISLVIGIVGAWFITGKQKAQLKSVKMQNDAKSYTKEGSLAISESRDFFLYKSVTKSERTDGSGASSTHTTKSGTTVGGGGGNF